jgi:hydrogenase/urease accessory protein HupE
MTVETIKTTMTYVIALVIIVGGGALLVIPTQLQPSELLPFLTGVIGVVVGYVFGERTASSAAANMPTVTTTSGPPPTTTITPADQGHPGELP